MTKKKLAIVVALAAVVALVALLAFATTTNSCIKRIATGPMMKDLQYGTTTFDVYAYHTSSDDCDCLHTAGTLTLWWRLNGNQTWIEYGSMTKALTALCGVDEYSEGVTFNSGVTIDFRVVDSADPNDCYRNVYEWTIP